MPVDILLLHLANLFSRNGSLGAPMGTNQCRERWKQQGELSEGQGCFNAFRRRTFVCTICFVNCPFSNALNQMLCSALIFFFGGYVPTECCCRGSLRVLIRIPASIVSSKWMEINNFILHCGLLSFSSKSILSFCILSKDFVWRLFTLDWFILFLLLNQCKISQVLYWLDSVCFCKLSANRSLNIWRKL